MFACIRIDKRTLGTLPQGPNCIPNLSGLLLAIGDHCHRVWPTQEVRGSFQAQQAAASAVHCSLQSSRRVGSDWLLRCTDGPVIPPQAKIREAEKRIAALTPTEELPNSDEARVKAIAKQETAIARVSNQHLHTSCWKAV